MQVSEENTEIKKGPRIKLLALGGAASRLLNVYCAHEVCLHSMLAVDTDLRSLEKFSKKNIATICLGKSYFRGFSSGGDESWVKKVLESDLSLIKSFLENTDILILLVGLGGGTGNGASMAIAQAAAAQGAFVLSVVLLPFDFEGQQRSMRAQSVLKALQSVCDLVVTFPNDTLFQFLNAEATVQEAFETGDRWLAKLLQTFFRLFFSDPCLGCDFNAFVRHFSDKPDLVFWGFGQGEVPDTAQDILKNLLTCPFWGNLENPFQLQGALVYALIGKNVPIAMLKDLHYELQCYLGNKQLKVLSAYGENALSPNTIEIFVLGSGNEQSLQSVRYRGLLSDKRLKRGPAFCEQQTHFNFEAAGEEAYWDTPTYLRKGLKIDL